MQWSDSAQEERTRCRSSHPPSSYLLSGVSAAPLRVCAGAPSPSPPSPGSEMEMKRSRFQAEEDGRRDEARRRLAPHGQRAAEDRAVPRRDPRSPPLIYRLNVGQKWSIHLRLSSHKLELDPAMVQPGRRGRGAVLCSDNLHSASGEMWSGCPGLMLIWY